MKKLTPLLLSAVLCLAANMQVAIAGLNEDTETAFDWAERQFPQIFPGHETSQVFDVWRFRYYQSTNTFAGVNTQNNSVFVKGGIFGNDPVYVNTLAKVLEMFQPAVACDTSKAPPGVSYLENSSRVKISTNGQCITLPTSGLCIPPVNTASQLSVLSKNNVKSYSYQGIKFSSPLFESTVSPLIRDAINVKTCLINAPADFATRPTEVDVCFDVTQKLNDVSFIKNLLIVTPPVTMSIQSTLSNEIVPSCFTTDAEIITDAFTNETWAKQNGTFVKTR